MVCMTGSNRVGSEKNGVVFTGDSRRGGGSKGPEALLGLTVVVNRNSNRFGGRDGIVRGAYSRTSMYERKFSKQS